MQKYPLSVEWDLEPPSINIEVTPSSLAKSMFFYVQAVGHFYTKKNYYTEREQYNSFLLVYTKSGIGNLRYRGKSYKLTAGDLFLIDCKQHHHYETDRKAANWEILWLHFDGGSSHSYWDQIYKNAGPVQSLREDSDIPVTLSRILEANRTRTLHQDIFCSKWIVDMLTELLLQSFSRSAEPTSPSIPSYILEIMNELERNCGAKITLEDLARLHNFSKYHLAREFKRYTGYNPNEYLTNVRMSLAKEMLKYSNLSVEEIAHHTGYNQTSFFIKMFRSKEGVTPLVFRQNWRP